VNEIVKLLKKVDPAVPNSWVVDGEPAIRALSSSGGGTMQVHQYFYEGNGNMNRARTFEDGVQTASFGAGYDAANRPQSFYLWGGIDIVRYANNYLNQRIRKRPTLEFYNFDYYIYDLAGNMIMDANTDGNWSEFVYLGGHRIALLGPVDPTPPSGAGCGGGCAIADVNNWQSVALNAFVVIIPGFFVLILIYRKKMRVKSVLFFFALAGGTIVLSYISIKAQPPEFAIYYYLNDHIDTPQKMVDQNADVVYEAYLEPFGKVSYEMGRINNFRFPGQYHDRESNIYYNWNRYYIPALGRYNRVDPIDFSDDFYKKFGSGYFNLFTYALNNPSIFIDRKGLDARLGFSCKQIEELAKKIKKAPPEHRGTFCSTAKIVCDQIRRSASVKRRPVF